MSLFLLYLHRLLCIIPIIPIIARRLRYVRGFTFPPRYKYNGMIPALVQQENSVNQTKVLLESDPALLDDVVYHAAHHGNLAIFDWLAVTNQPTNIAKAVYWFAKNDHRHLLRWARKKWEKESNEIQRFALSGAAAGGKIDTFQWILSWNPIPNDAILFHNLSTNALRGNQPLKVLEWLESTVPPEVEKIRDAFPLAVKTHKDVALVQWLHEHQWPYSSEVERIAASLGCLDVVLYLVRHHLVKDSRKLIQEALVVYDEDLTQISSLLCATEVLLAETQLSSYFPRQKVVQRIYDYLLQALEMGYLKRWNAIDPTWENSDFRAVLHSLEFCVEAISDFDSVPAEIYSYLYHTKQKCI